MPSAGIKPTKECAAACENLINKHLNRFCIMGFSDDNKCIEVKHLGEKDATFDDMLKQIEVIGFDKALYLVFDCKYETVGGQSREKVLAVSYSDDDLCQGRPKMLLSSSQKDLAPALKGVAKFVEIKDKSELTEENFINEVSENRKK